MEPGERPVNFSVEKMKRRYLPGIIKEFTKYLDDRETFEAGEVKEVIDKAKQAITGLETGDPTAAIEMIDWDLMRVRAWKTMMVNTQNEKSVAESDKEIADLEKLKEEISSNE